MEAVMAELGPGPKEVCIVIVLASTTLVPTQVASMMVVGEKQAARFVNSHTYLRRE